MAVLQIEGPCRLEGEVRVQGAKNSALPLLAASVLGKGVSVFRNCPHLSDVETSIQILSRLGCAVHWAGEDLVVDASDADGWAVPDELMGRMRSSILFLGSCLGRTGQGSLSYPGGCALGPRPIDLHLEGLQRLGAVIRERHGRLDCTVGRGLTGCEIPLAFPSVGATENLLLAAVTAKGVTTIHNAAREPEIVDLADYLNDCGGDIQGAGESAIVVRGVDALHGAEHTVCPDRIAAATYLAAGAATGGEVVLRDVEPSHLIPVVHVLEGAGCKITMGADTLSLEAPLRLRPLGSITTLPYPGFPTDCQSPVMAASLLADGTTVFVENLFDSRYKAVDELVRLGGRIQVSGRVAVVQGVERLSGARVTAPDLRGGAALVIAGLCAEGTTTVVQAELIDRGYGAMEDVLQRLGAKIWRVASTSVGRHAAKSNCAYESCTRELR